MHASEAFTKFHSMSVEDALNTIVPFGKHSGSKVADISFAYADWIRENVQAQYADESKFKFLYAVSTIFESDRCILPDDYKTSLKDCLK